jgi:6-phospho-beta-glucosidase
MGESVRIAVIGAGSTYTPELIGGFIRREAGLELSEIRLMDIDRGKLGAVGSLVRRMLERSLPRARLALTEDLDASLRGVDFALCQIRVGGLATRALDEKIPLGHGLIGQETTGLGGFMSAMRTIPAVARIARRLAELSPSAWLVNFANPSGLVTEAIRNNLGFERIIGLCNVPINMKADLAALAPPGTRLGLEYIGLNHFSWITKIFHDGIESRLDACTAAGSRPEGLAGGIGAMRNIPGADFDAELLASIGAIPNSYLQYFYYRDRQLAHLREAPLCRAEECMLIEKELLESYKDEGLRSMPAALERRGGHLYSEAAVSLIEAIANDRGREEVVNVRNEGALPFMDPEDVVEISCSVGASGARPIRVEGFANDHIIGMMRLMKAYEKVAAKAAILGDRGQALRALLMHPLAGDYPRAKAAFDELMEAEAAFLPQFLPTGKVAS